jgi:hypothetical protein
MSCQTLNEAIVDLARGMEVGEGTAAAIRAHVGHCAACAARFEREEALSAGLRALQASAAGAAPSGALQQRLMDEFDASQAATRPATSRGVSRGWLQAAAAIAIGVGAIAAWRLVSPPQVAVQQTISENRVPAGVAPQVPPTPAPTPAAATGPSPSSARTTPGNQRGSGTRPSRVLHPTGFVQLPAAAGLPAFESGQIVRVEIPVTSLPMYGVDILPDAVNRPVRADLLVGQDGLPRAIRLIRTVAVGTSRSEW